ncbi:hypothetical protein [Mucilaginibacter sp. UR6-11]|uniref:hypothetical protein n=1 Tax=Mucilaginibacter sp. UR6-11 TaxID=1435644 RepID=UPI001E595DE5|nr:hypothetical protein [Mucilaginibacter sp. UR6-11]MCC8426943.1 hypothetical protein [Mucilaginibacter sp. UR6-11]
MENFVASGTYNDKITIQIDCKDGKYRYRIYDAVGTIPSAYTSLTGTIPSRDFTPEALIDKLLGNKNNSPFTKGQSRKTLESLNIETLSTISSLNKAMAAKTDTF